MKCYASYKHGCGLILNPLPLGTGLGVVHRLPENVLPQRGKFSAHHFPGCFLPRPEVVITNQAQNSPISLDAAPGSSPYQSLPQKNESAICQIWIILYSFITTSHTVQTGSNMVPSQTQFRGLPLGGNDLYKTESPTCSYFVTTEL